MRGPRHWGVVLACVCVVGAPSCDTAFASPGWSAPRDFALPGSPLQSSVQIGYQAGGTATVAYLEVASVSPLQTVLHVGTIAPGGSYQEQLRIASTAGSIPLEPKLAENSSGAAVLQWPVLEGSEPASSPLSYVASYRAADSTSWEAPVVIATDATRVSGINYRLVPAISADGTAAAGAQHLDPTISAPGGYRVDVSVHPPGGAWAAPAQVSPAKDSSEGLVLGLDAVGNLTAAFQLELSNTRHTLAAERRPVSSGVWGSLEDVTGSDVTSDVGTPTLGVGPDGSAVIAFQYVHYAGSKTLDVNAVIRPGATGSWSAPVDVAPGGASSGPLAAGVSPDGHAYVLYRYQGSSSGEDCVGAVRTAATFGSFTSPRCVSAMNFEPGFAGGVGFLGNDAYFAWSGQPNGGKAYVVEGGRWLDQSSLPDSFTDLESPIESAGLDQLLADEDGSIAAFWTTRVETSPGKYESKLRAAAFDEGGPNLTAAAVPATALAGAPVTMSASFADLWSSLGEAPSWSFGDGSGATGTQVTHTYATPGIYTVTVSAADVLGNRTSKSYTVTVSATPAPPRASLTLLGAKVVGGGVLVSLACAGAPCAGEALLTAKEKLRGGKLLGVSARRRKPRITYRTVVLGSVSFALTAGQHSTVSVALNASGRKLLARMRKLRAKLTIKLGASALASKSLTFSASRHHAKRRKR